MSAGIPTLWPEELANPLITPWVVLAAQARALVPITGGKVTGEITTVEFDERGVTMCDYLLDIYSPLINYRERILVATHDPERVYPVSIQAESFRPAGAAPTDRWGVRVAKTYTEFVELVREVLRSPPVVAAIRSMMARTTAREALTPTPV